MDLSEYTREKLEVIETFLLEAHDENVNGVLQLIKEIRSELRNRKNCIEAEEKIKKTYLGKYVRIDYGTGLGTFGTFKVGEVKYNELEETIELSTKVEIYINDGIYSIEENSEVGINPQSLSNIELIDEKTYSDEFNKAIEHYKSLKQ